MPGHHDAFRLSCLAIGLIFDFERKPNYDKMYLCIKVNWRWASVSHLSFIKLDISSSYSFMSICFWQNGSSKSSENIASLMLQSYLFHHWNNKLATMKSLKIKVQTDTNLHLRPQILDTISDKQVLVSSLAVQNSQITTTLTFRSFFSIKQINSNSTCLDTIVS